jgi:hypothetical protein
MRGSDEAREFFLQNTYKTRKKFVQGKEIVGLTSGRIARPPR